MRLSVSTAIWIVQWYRPVTGCVECVEAITVVVPAVAVVVLVVGISNGAE